MRCSGSSRLSENTIDETEVEMTLRSPVVLFDILYDFNRISAVLTITWQDSSTGAQKKFISFCLFAFVKF